MKYGDRQSSFLDWGSSPGHHAGLRSIELYDRIWWFINMRWVATGICALCWVVLNLNWFPVKVRSSEFLSGVIALCFLNILYIVSGRKILSKEKSVNDSLVRFFLRVQIIGDFIILSFLNYQAGTIETPIFLLYVPHIILAALFFRRIKSFMIAIVAWVFAVASLCLECQGLIPVVSIFSNGFKSHLMQGNCVLAKAFMLGLGITFLTIWYIISEITTSLKLREQQLEHAYDMLKKLDSEKTHATLRATHELKAPFAAIKSYIYSLRDGYCGVLPEKAGKVIERIGERCDRLMDKISDIIHLSNIKTLVVSHLNFAPVDLKEILQEEVAECDLLGHPRKISVHLDAPGEPLFICGSKPHLKTLFSNLIGNAVSYSKPGDSVIVQLVCDKNNLIVKVSDQGIGIAKEHFEKIFEEHFRSNQAVSHYPNGTGLGLPMVRELVKLHQGELSFQSEVNVGTTFEITFKSVTPESKEVCNDKNSNNR